MSGRWPRRAAVLAGALLLAVAALVDVTIVEPRVHVRWRDAVTDSERQAREANYGLAAGQVVEGTTWRYEIRDPSPQNVEALIRDPLVADTAYIDRATLEVPGREVDVSFARARQLVGPDPFGFVQLQSGLLLGAAALLAWAARHPDLQRRRLVALATVATLGVAQQLLPLHQPLRMGDSQTYTKDRESFELFSGVRQIRFEAHLSHAILGRIDAMLGRDASSPSRALDVLMRAAGLVFIGAAVAIGVVEQWSPAVLRYLALAVAAPSALLYFGYRELGHLSLNVAAFPLLLRGLRAGTGHLEAGSGAFGLGAALHGFGLLSIAGAALASIGTGRLRTLLRVIAWAVAAYLGWVALYLVILKLPVVPGHAESVPLRPWLVDEIGQRVNAAIFSRTGLRDVLLSLWVTGAPLLAMAASLRRVHPADVRAALLYSVPSLVFLVMFWPIQGLGVEMDLVFAAFPAMYAAAWMCAQDARQTRIALIVLASAHVVFWRVVLDSAFVNSRIG